ncbi:MAG: hypothetical protein C3F07_12530 [Anaerolineales bacterium]|nr:hypothetical protein [Anaerolineae bacterium]PWB72136.1 MAG: hypothetical protein C3F07_12530 [Anaerolineales bacterium]
MGEPEPGYDRKEILYRIGTFFLLLGLGVLVFFFLSEAAEKPTFSYFCGSIVLLGVGFFFRAQYRKAVKSSGRFSIFKRFKRGSDK